MKMGLTISVVGHAAALLWAVVTFGVTPHDATPPDALPIDIVSATEFSKMTAGQKSAPKLAAAKPLVEKVGDTKRTDNEANKVSDKPEIITASAKTADPPAPKPPELKPAPKAEAKPEAKPQEAEKKPEAKPDAEALKKEEQKKPEPKKEEAKVQLPPKKPPPPQPKPLDFRNIEQKLALLDKREGQRHAYAGETLSATPTLGTRTGNAPTLSQNEMDAVRACLNNNWNVPAGVLEAKTLQVEVEFSLKRDGSLSAAPKVVNNSSHPLFQIAAENALRAVHACAPFTFLPIAKYEAWQDFSVKFDPKELNRS